MLIRTPPAGVVWVLRLLCATALCVSGYLAYAGLTGSKIVGCGGGLWDCDHVTSDPQWSNWFGVPVAVPACLLYLVCLGSLGFANSPSESLRRTVWRVISLAGIAAGLAAIWFVSLQIMVIGHLCKWCLVAHSCGILVAATVLWFRPAAPYTTKIAILSVLGVGVLVGGQLIHKPQTFVIEDFSDPGGDPGSSIMMSPPGEDEAAGDGSDEFLPPGMDEDEGMEFAPPPIEEDIPSEQTDSGL